MKSPLALLLASLAFISPECSAGPDKTLFSAREALLSSSITPQAALVKYAAASKKTISAPITAVWWKGHVAIYDPRLKDGNHDIWTAFREGRLYGKGSTSWWDSTPRWYRYYKPDIKEESVVQKIIERIRSLIR